MRMMRNRSEVIAANEAAAAIAAENALNE